MSKEVFELLQHELENPFIVAALSAVSLCIHKRVQFACSVIAIFLCRLSSEHYCASLFLLTVLFFFILFNTRVSWQMSH